MARDIGFKERRLKEEKDQDDADLDRKLRARIDAKRVSAFGGRLETVKNDQEPMEARLRSVATLLDQVNQQFGLYFTGVEKRIPAQARSLLDQKVKQLVQEKKSTPTQQFQWNSFFQKYQLDCERWERTLKEIESGKKKKPV